MRNRTSLYSIEYRDVGTNNNEVSCHKTLDVSYSHNHDYSDVVCGLLVTSESARKVKVALPP